MPLQLFGVATAGSAVCTHVEAGQVVELPVQQSVRQLPDGHWTAPLVHMPPATICLQAAPSQ